MFFENLFKLSISAFLLVLISGIVGAELTGSDKAFELRPALSILKGIWGVGERTMSGEIVGDGEDPEPFGEVAARAKRRIVGHIEEGLKDIPDDPRLAGCPAGSAELGRAEIKFAKASGLYEQHQESPVRSLLDVQAALGSPHCNYQDGDRTVWKFVVTGFRVLKATETPNGVEFESSWTNK
jgi:hypothetical protein